jgi:hypothetical protein
VRKKELNFFLTLISSFKTNVEKLAQLVDDVPMKSSEKAVWHIEHVIRNNGAKHLRYHQKEIPFYQFHFYDIFLSISLAIILVLLIIYCLLKVTGKCVRRLMNFKSKSD